jgi:hypothetical protein
MDNRRSVKTFFINRNLEFMSGGMIMKRNILLLLFFVAGLTCYDSQLQASHPKGIAKKIQAKKLFKYNFDKELGTIEKFMAEILGKKTERDGVASKACSLVERASLDRQHPFHLPSANVQKFLKTRFRQFTNPNLLSIARKGVHSDETRQKYESLKFALKDATQKTVDALAENMTRYLDRSVSDSQPKSYEFEEDKSETVANLSSSMKAISSCKLPKPADFDVDFSSYDQTHVRHQEVYHDYLRQDPNNITFIKYGKHMPIVDVGIRAARPIGQACTYVGDKVVFAAPRAIRWSGEMVGCVGDALSQEGSAAIYDGAVMPLAGLGIAGYILKKAWDGTKGHSMLKRLLYTGTTIAISPTRWLGLACSVVSATASLQSINENKKNNGGFFYEYDEQESSSRKGIMRAVSAAAAVTGAYCCGTLEDRDPVGAVKKALGKAKGIVADNAALMRLVEGCNLVGHFAPEKD